jgi:hypothetical protein
MLHETFLLQSNWMQIACITEETWLVEMRIWCIKIGIVLVLHCYILVFLIPSWKIIHNLKLASSKKRTLSSISEYMHRG